MQYDNGDDGLQDGDKIIDLTTDTGKEIVAAFGGLLEKLAWLQGEDVLFGCVTLFGVKHHVTIVRVMQDEMGYQVGTRDPEERLDDVLKGADCSGYTVELPGFEGEWVLGVDPYRD